MAQVPDLVAYMKGYGGYFRRFRGGALQQWAVPGEVSEEHLDLEAHATYAFLQVSCGTTGVTILTSHRLLNHRQTVKSPRWRILRTAVQRHR